MLSSKIAQRVTLVYRVAHRFKEAKSKEVPVENKELDRVVWVLPETLKEDPGKYEKLSPKDLQQPYQPPHRPKPPERPLKPAKPHKPRKPETPRNGLPHPKPIKKPVPPVKPVPLVPTLEPVPLVPVPHAPIPRSKR